MSALLYLDTSAVLRAVLEAGVSPEVEQRIAQARVLMTSRLSLVEVARALLRLRVAGAASEAVLADAAREVDSLWARCVIWELTAKVCELAAQVAPLKPLCTLDAIHLATYLLARRRLGEEVSLLTVDQRLEEAAASV
ncbi:MAG: type II toxin-antitoxin system VapC family toxin [Gemmatimonadetes bacterium]|nr:type II toxin-antitoxin system VapC family toxin [Gemmatimonadota bacterium]